MNGGGALLRAATEMKSLIWSLLRADRTIDLVPADLLLLRHDLDCGYNHLGRRYSTLIDSIADIAKCSGFTATMVAKPYSVFSCEEFYRPPTTINRRYLATTVSGRFKAIGRGSGHREAAQATIRRSLWDRILDVVMPRAIVGIHTPIDLFAAADARSIPCHEMQHGVILADGEYYRELFPWMRVASSHSKVLCWDESTADRIDKVVGGAPRSHTAVVGNPWLNRFVTPIPGDTLAEEMRTRVPQCGKRPRILVSLQWKLDELYRARAQDSAGFDGIMPEAVREAILRTAGKYEWWIKLHPFIVGTTEERRQRRILEQRFGSLGSVRWADVASLPLPALLGEATLHLTDSSAATTEAAQIGVPTGLWNPMFRDRATLEDWFPAACRDGLAEPLVWEADRIVEWLGHAVAMRKQTNQLRQAPGSRQELLDAIFGVRE